MKLTLWKTVHISAKPEAGAASVPECAPKLDARAEQYFAKAGRYNAVAAELGFESLEHAIRAGKMQEILTKASAQPLAVSSARPPQ